MYETTNITLVQVQMYLHKDASLCEVCLLCFFLLSSDRKACENIQGKPIDLAYNAASYVWRPEIGSKVRNAHC